MKHVVKVLVALSSLFAMFILPSSPALAQNSSVHATAGCAQMSAKADITKFSRADFDRYGLPYLGNMPLQKWHMLVDGTKHVCGNGKSTQYSHTLKAIHTLNNGGYANSNWEGNIADSSTGPFTEANLYNEADAVFYVPPVPSGTHYGHTGIWVGLGGVDGSSALGDGNPSLTQAGIDYAYDPLTGTTQWFPWVENIGATTSQGNQGCSGPYTCALSPSQYPLYPGDRIQVHVYQNQMYIGSNRGWGNTWTYGPNPDNSTADWIVEMLGGGPLDNFGSATFYGMGDTQTNGIYTGPYWQNHDYAILQDPYTNDILCTIGPLSYNTAWGPPNDSNTIYFYQNQ